MTRREEVLRLAAAGLPFAMQMSLQQSASRGIATSPNGAVQVSYNAAQAAAIAISTALAVQAGLDDVPPLKEIAG